jgi:hypothetical protein
MSHYVPLLEKTPLVDKSSNERAALSIAGQQGSDTQPIFRF